MLGCSLQSGAGSMNDSELRSVDSADMLRDEALGKALLALNNAHAQELSWLEAERLEYLDAVKRSSQDGLATSTPSCSRSIRTRDTTARISSGSAPAIRALCMSTGSWSRHRRADAVARDGSIPTCSNTPSAPGTTASSARSTQFRQTPLQMPSMRRWALSRSAPPASMTEAGRFATCRKRYRVGRLDLTPRARSRGISPPRP